MPTTRTDKRNAITTRSIKALAQRIAEIDAKQMTARELSERFGEPLYVIYAALLELGYTTDAGDYLPTFGTPEEPQPLYERIAQIDTSDMTLDEIAERFNTTTSRARNALTFLARFARHGGYKPASRAEPAEEEVKDESESVPEPRSAPKPRAKRLLHSRQAVANRLTRRHEHRGRD